jgi:Bacterial Ig-like domain (group 2)
MTDWPPLHDYGHSRAVIMGTWDYAYLQAVPPAENSFRRTVSLLTGPLCSWPEDRLVTLENKHQPGDLADRLITAFEEVTDVALFYYVGHGQIDEEDQLCLALTESRPESHRRAATSLEFSAVRRALLRSDAATKIVILDCCFAAVANRRDSSLAGSPDDVLDKTAGTGAYTMAATNAYGTAWYETDPSVLLPQTYFTEYLVDLIERGIEGQPSGLKLHPLFRKLHDNLAAAGRPVPESRSLDGAREFVFAHNAAPPATQRDPEIELQRLQRQLNETDAKLAAAEARLQILIPEQAKRHNDLDRLQVRQARQTQLVIAQRQRELQNAIKAAERDKATTIAAETPAVTVDPESARITYSDVSSGADVTDQPVNHEPASARPPEQAELKSANGSRGTYPAQKNAAQGVKNPQPEQQRHKPWRRRSRAILLSGFAGLILIATLVWVLPLRPPRPQATRPISYHFPQHRYVDGLVVARNWTLGGKNGSLLTEKITVTSAIGAALRVPFEEPIPPAIAAMLGTARFSPTPPQIIDDSHVLEWELRVPAHGSDVVSYSASVASVGATKVRLERWATAFSKLPAGPVSPPGAPAMLTSLTIMPRVIRITVGGAKRLALVGTLSDGKLASSTLLAKVVWTTQNSRVAVVNSVGKVTAKASGKTRVTARVGAVSAFIFVTVDSSIGPNPGATSPYVPTQTTTPTPRPATTSPAPTPHPTTLTPSPI